PAVYRWATDDRVMKATQGVMDARGRVAAAWQVLVNGHEVPSVDPSLDLRVEERVGVLGWSSFALAPESSPVGGETARPETLEVLPVSLGCEDMNGPIKQRNSLAGLTGKDVLEKCYPFTTADNARKLGIYPYFRPLDLNDGPEAVVSLHLSRGSSQERDVAHELHGHARSRAPGPRPGSFQGGRQEVWRDSLIGWSRLCWNRAACTAIEPGGGPWAGWLARLPRGDCFPVWVR
ncbi:hypothetical protein ACFL5O_09535, partial [Myxococcota bacterium]